MLNHNHLTAIHFATLLPAESAAFWSAYFKMLLLILAVVLSVVVTVAGWLWLVGAIKTIMPN